MILVRKSKWSTHAHGTSIVNAGDPCQDLIVPVHGKLSVLLETGIYENNDGDASVPWIGAESCTEDEPLLHGCTIVADGDVELVQLPGAAGAIEWVLQP